jgi:ComF family protein
MSEAGAFLINCSRELLSWVYPPKCALCGALGEASPCETCGSSMRLAEPNFVREPEGALEFRACVYAYEGRVAQAVRRLKYARCTSLLPFMAQAVAARLAELAEDGDLIIPVPMNWARRAWRGFNQSELLLKETQGIQVHAGALKRVRNTRPQAGLPLLERQANLRGAFRATAEVEARSVILVDDVVTSGETARECAAALVEAGASSVGIVAFAGNLE